ncbi:DctP family TRAP transporter solute-binding subunit [Ammoniphilus sp. YIM 78166]|uniref:TRAP transporter substrate-binding protein n=1 Tax=Ammoniphilus sp. YIM 78166 TaxID=1644106 RepID=UPI0010704264|nr:DctP family TRAP transporter solute-binding subunit [Ammoniphilus sp. YIM 78166]
MKKISTLLSIALSSIVLLSACSSSDQPAQTSAAPEAGKVYSIKIAHNSPQSNDRLEDSLQAFKKEVEEKSNGAIQISTHPAGQLGGERENMEGVQMGSIEMAVLSTGPIPGIYPNMMVTDLPFLFKNEQIADAVLDGPVGQEILDGMSSVGVKGLAWGENGFRHFANKVRPIEKPEDIQGLKIRTMENPAHMAMVQSMGGSPTPMAFGEVYTSVQQGVIDGLENPISLMESMRFYEVSKYFTLDGHLYGPYVMMMNADFFNSLPQDLQTIIQEAAKDWSKLERDLNRKQEAKGLENMKAQGMEVVELSSEQKDAFQKATQPVYDKYRNELEAGLVDKIVEAVKQAEKEHQ